MKTEQLRDAPFVPGALNVSGGDVMETHDAAVAYVQDNPDARRDRQWSYYQNRDGMPTPKSVRIRNMKERAEALKRKGRVK